MRGVVGNIIEGISGASPEAEAIRSGGESMEKAIWAG
jgi:hypothetical protein